MNKFQNIVIASDLDGTYFGRGSSIVGRNVERVKYFCDNGGHFTFSTGRLPIFMRKSLPNAAELINMPAITGNGTCLYDFAAERAIEEHFLDFEEFFRLSELVHRNMPNAGFRGVINSGFVVHDLANPYNKREYEQLPDFMEKKLMPINEWESLDIYKVNLFDEPEKLALIYPLLREKFGQTLNVSRAGTTCIEIMPRGTSKAVMLKKTVERMFGKDAVLCAAGDYDNDLEMLALADIPVCPSNANDAVKAICRNCLCSNDDGVIGDLVDMLDKEF